MYKSLLEIFRNTVYFYLVFMKVFFQILIIILFVVTFTCFNGLNSHKQCVTLTRVPDASLFQTIIHATKRFLDCVKHCPCTLNTVRSFLSASFTSFIPFLYTILVSLLATQMSDFHVLGCADIDLQICM